MGEIRPPRGGSGATGGSRSGQHVSIEFDTGRGRARANDSFLIFARAPLEQFQEKIPRSFSRASTDVAGRPSAADYDLFAMLAIRHSIRLAILLAAAGVCAFSLVPRAQAAEGAAKGAAPAAKAKSYRRLPVVDVGKEWKKA